MKEIDLIEILMYIIVGVFASPFIVLIILLSPILFCLGIILSIIILLMFVVYYIKEKIRNRKSVSKNSRKQKLSND